MKGYKKIIAIAAMLATAGTVVGCKSGKSGHYTPFDGDPTQLTAKVTFWHTMGQANQETLNRMITAFNEKYPNITIEHAAQGGYDDIKEKISAAIPAGTTPTMAYCYPDHVAEYMSAGAVEEMSGYVKDAKIGLSKEQWDSAGGESDFINGFWQEGKEYGEEFGEKDGLYSVPFSKSTEVLFYNKDFFDTNGFTVPTTWTEMEELMPKIKDLGYCALGYDSDANMLITMMEQEGIPYTSAEKDNHYLFNNPEAKALVQKLKTWYDNGWIITSGSSANNSYTSNMFVQKPGSEPFVVMSIGSTGGTRYNYTDAFEVGVAPIPAGTLNNHVISQGPSICFFSRATLEEKYAAWLFYKWISNTDNSAVYSILTGYSPVRSSSFNAPAFVEYREKAQSGENKLIQTTLLFNEQLQDRFFVSPAFKGSSTARSEMDGIIANVFLGTKTIDKAFDDALTNCLFAG